MKLAVSILAICFLCLAIVPLLQSEDRDSDAVAAITQLENDGVKADLAHDSSFAKKRLSDDFVAGTSFGDWESKDSQLKDADDPVNNKTNTAALSKMKVNVYGNTAIARYVNTYDDVHHGQPRSRSVICTDTWVNEGGAWKEVANHCSQAR